jgi:hypothetical protein
MSNACAITLEVSDVRDRRAEPTLFVPESTADSPPITPDSTLDNFRKLKPQRLKARIREN